MKETGSEDYQKYQDYRTNIYSCTIILYLINNSSRGCIFLNIFLKDVTDNFGDLF